MADLLDALHYLFEDDLTPSTGEQQEARENVRKSIYVDLYGDESYEWVAKRDERGKGQFSGSAPRVTTASGQQVLDGMPPEPELTHKGYIPPTKVDPAAAKPFGDVLDAPLG